MTRREEMAMIPNRFLDVELRALRASGYSREGFWRFARALWQRSREVRRERPGLVRQRNLVFVLGLVLVSVTAVGLAQGRVLPLLPTLPIFAALWLLLWAWVGVELGLLRHPLTDAPVAGLGAANVLSLCRGWLAAPLLLLGVFTGGPGLVWLAFFLCGGATDLVDGTIAIRLHQESRLGRLLDPVMDSLFFSSAAFDLARWQLLPGWVAAAVALRYNLPVVGGLVLIFVRASSLPVRHTIWGQVSTAAIGLALGVHWLATVLSVAPWLLTATNLAALTTMLLALLGIARRAPLPRVARLP